LAERHGAMARLLGLLMIAPLATKALELKVRRSSLRTRALAHCDSIVSIQHGVPGARDVSTG